MKSIALSRGHVAMVDDADFDALSRRTWSAAVRRNGRVYAVTNERLSPGRWRVVLMHRVILELTGSRTPDVDHIDGNGLNNCRANLRVATRAENNANQQAQVGRSSRFKGVSWNTSKRKWRAGIKSDGRNRHLGYFDTEAAAARAYDAAAAETFGTFARPNGAFR